MFCNSPRDDLQPRTRLMEQDLDLKSGVVAAHKFESLLLLFCGDAQCDQEPQAGTVTVDTEHEFSEAEEDEHAEAYFYC